MPRDVVCGMEVEKEQAAGVSSYRGKEYYFCSKHCKERFDQTPEKYVESKGDSKEELMHSQSQVKSKPSEKVNLPIAGMTCASCAQTIQKGLSDLKGVDKASVNFATSRATVSYDSEQAQVKDLISAIRGSGYDVGTASIELPILGIDCASCVQKIEKALLAT